MFFQLATSKKVRHVRHLPFAFISAVYSSFNLPILLLSVVTETAYGYVDNVPTAPASDMERA
jgi:hypothetical protein